MGLTGDNDKELTELEKLPPLTTTGENTFGCLVNGEALVIKNTSKQVAIFQQGQLQFGASMDQSAKHQSLNFILGDPLRVNKPYFFMNEGYHVGFTLKRGETICLYESSKTFSGSLEFANIDRSNFIISGTFEFSTVTEGCDTVHVTDGRFDMQYVP